MTHGKTVVALLWSFGIAGALQAADSFEYPVFRHHLPRKEAGRLVISTVGIRYRSDNQKTAIDIPLINVFEADVSDPKMIRFETYDIVKRRILGRQVHVFQLRNGVHDELLTRFLSKAIQRPVVGAFGPVLPPEATIRAYHRHRLGGCHGTIRIDSDAIRFQSDKPRDSRTWLYQDVETLGAMDAFHFRISTFAETFNFDLQERLSEDAYDKAVRHVYALPAPANRPQ
jgi:hypothetical protein